VVYGQRWPSDIYVGVRGPAGSWIKGEYRFSGKAHTNLNRQIDQMASLVQGMADNLERSGALSALTLHKAVSARNTKPIGLLELAELYAAHMYEGKSESTRKVYQCWLGCLRVYIGKKEVSTLSITDAWLRDYDTYLATRSGFPNTAAYTRRRKIEKVLACLKWGYQTGRTPQPPPTYYRPKKDLRKPPIYLTSEELSKLASAADHDTERVRDCFLFSAYTGLAYTDQASFVYSRDTYLDSSGRRWLKKPRNKNGIEAELPLLPEAEAILQKYQGQVPTPSNQEFNRMLKLLAARVGIKKHLTTHVARKTCATRFLNLGISEQVIARFMGWESTAMLKVYARVYNEGMERELFKLGLG
jgi:site-specific recombinase XerD